MEDGCCLLGLGKLRGGDTVAVFMEEPMDFSSQPEENPLEAAGGVGMVKPAGCLGREGGFQVNCLTGRPHVNPMVSIFIISFEWKHTVYLSLLLTGVPQG